MEEPESLIQSLTARWQWVFEGSGQLRVQEIKTFEDDHHPAFYDVTFLVGDGLIPQDGTDEFLRAIVRKTRRYAVIDPNRINLSPHELISKLERRGWVVDYLETCGAVDEIKGRNIYPRGVIVFRPLIR